MKKATIYTGCGDDGTTSLMHGTRVSKDHPRVEAYGTIDELNACIGLLCACLPAEHHTLMQRIENNLLTIGCALADETDSTPTIAEEDITTLEEEIDKLEASMPPMHKFILPATNEAAARANLCRTICRRAERRLVTMQRECPTAPCTATYINRLSDYLFLLQRQLAEGVEKKWEKPCM
ncbi:MAG: cob(I)yrinic acid a,c-diamide adenosyltransferase [Bacteroidaceae bacterium]|nr:cob(I)yrinic acid a,c-diamide adenosyltransferase [Bacteroidaceae bacterium]